MINVDSTTLHSYLQANYHVVDSEKGETHTVRIGQANSDVNAMLHRHNARTGLIITAWNPHSVEQSAIRNRANNVNLLRHQLVADIQVRVYPAYGSDDAATWQEDGFLLTNIDCRTAQQLCYLFKQNAGVLLDIDHPPALVWHPEVIIPEQ